MSIHDINKLQQSKDSQYQYNNQRNYTSQMESSYGQQMNGNSIKGISNIQPEFTSLNSGYLPSLNHQNQSVGQIYSNYTDITSSQFDKIATGVSHLSMNMKPMVHNTYHTGPINSIYHKSTSDEMCQLLGRKDFEMERLKLRNEMLEQQQAQVNAISMNSNDFHSLKYQYESTISKLQNDILLSKQREEKLDEQLNKKEYEISNMKDINNELIKEKNKDLAKYQSDFTEKEKQFVQTKNEYKDYKDEIDRINHKLNERNDYISKLPTNEEFDQLKEKINKSNKEKEDFIFEIKDLEKKVHRAKTLIKEQKTIDKDLQEKLKKSQLDKKDIHDEYEQYKKATQDVGDLMKKCEENAQLHAQYELAKEMLLKNEKEMQLQHKINEQKLQMIKEEAQIEIDMVQSLRKDLEIKERDLKNLTISFKQISSENQKMMHENLNLNEKCKSFELMLSEDTTKLLHLLFNELNICTDELSDLVKNCIDIYDQKSIDVDELLGYGNKKPSYLNADLATRITQAAALINEEFIIKKTNEIKSFRKKLDEVRKKVSNEYAENIAANITCNTQ